MPAECSSGRPRASYVRTLPGNVDPQRAPHGQDNALRPRPRTTWLTTGGFDGG
jgi:hypothetical protein